MIREKTMLRTLGFNCFLPGVTGVVIYIRRFGFIEALGNAELRACYQIVNWVVIKFSTGGVNLKMV
jgi:hypothetical protein